MSEIKGQLLGIVLVLMIFAVVSAAMVEVFNNLSDSVVNEVNNVIEEIEE